MAKMKKAVFMSEEAIMNRIYYIRKHKVMLDKDLAELYGVKPIRLREQVKRNIERFPDNYMFQLTRKETSEMVSQNAIPSISHMGGYLPYAFTEHGVLMLANVLKSQKAIAVSLRLIEIFVKMRQVIAGNRSILKRLEKLEKRVNDNSEEVRELFAIVKELIYPSQKEREQIGFRRPN